MPSKMNLFRCLLKKKNHSQEKIEFSTAMCAHNQVFCRAISKTFDVKQQESAGVFFKISWESSSFGMHEKYETQNNIRDFFCAVHYLMNIQKQDGLVIYRA